MQPVEQDDHERRVIVSAGQQRNSEQPDRKAGQVAPLAGTRVAQARPRRDRAAGRCSRRRTGSSIARDDQSRGGEPESTACTVHDVACRPPACRSALPAGGRPAS